MLWYRWIWIAWREKTLFWSRLYHRRNQKRYENCKKKPSLRMNNRMHMYMYTYANTRRDWTRICNSFKFFAYTGEEIDKNEIGGKVHLHTLHQWWIRLFIFEHMNISNAYNNCIESIGTIDAHCKRARQYCAFWNRYRPDELYETYYGNRDTHTKELINSMLC